MDAIAACGGKEAVAIRGMTDGAFHNVAMKTTTTSCKNDTTVRDEMNGCYSRL